MAVSEGWLLFIFFAPTLFGSALSIRAGINAARRKVGRWDRESTRLFLASLGSFGEGRIKFWQLNSTYFEAEARIIAEYQTWALLGCFASFFGAAAIETCMANAGMLFLKS